MLESVDQIESSGRQRPRDAKPGEIAAALRALAFASSDDAAQLAYHRVLFAVGNDHRGTYFPSALVDKQEDLDAMLRAAACVAQREAETMGLAVAAFLRSACAWRTIA